MLEVKTSPKASAAEALRAPESILLPMNLLKRDNQYLNPIEIRRSINGTISNLTSVGFIILSKEDFINCKPTSITKNATNKADKYSILPCPKGCSASAGLSAILKPTIVITEDAASDKLLKASADTAIEPTNKPTKSLTKNKIILTIIPTIPPNVP